MALRTRKRFCNYAGSEEQHRPDQRGFAPWQRESEGGTDSPEGNEKMKTALCFFFSWNGLCFYGEDCIFAHGEQELRRDSRTYYKKVGMWTPPSEDKTTSWWDSGKWSDTSDQTGWVWREAYCPFFQLGCCYFGSTCVYKHERAPKDTGRKLRLCKFFEDTGTCFYEDECWFAHGRQELRTPEAFKGVSGYKSCLCTFYMMEGIECLDDNCADAHGPLDLRRLPLSVPRELKEPFRYSDAHVHMEQVLLSRRYGTSYFYKQTPCKNKPRCRYRAEDCLWYHGEQDRRPLLHPDREDLASLAEEMLAMPLGIFDGAVHSCCEATGIEDAVNLARWGRELLGGKLYVSFGIHPNNFEDFTPEVEAQLLAAIEVCGPQAVAWGECGLDYFRRDYELTETPEVKLQMKNVFAAQARLAVKHQLPLVVHSRDADEDMIQILKENVPRHHHIYLHSFMGSEWAVDQLLSGWPNSFVGLAGCVTFREWGLLWDMAQSIPLDRLLVETDGPFMAPEPYRGEESHPGQVVWIAASIARAKGLPTAEVMAAVHNNFKYFYRL